MKALKKIYFKYLFVKVYLLLKDFHPPRIQLRLSLKKVLNAKKLYIKSIIIRVIKLTAILSVY